MKRAAIGVLGFLLLTVGCSQTVEGELKKWKQHNDAVKELVVLYPGFKVPLEAQLTEAKKAWEAAQAITEQESKIEKMAAANGLLSGGFVSQLSGADTKIRKIRTKAIEVVGGSLDESDRASAKLASDDAQKIIAGAETTLKKGAGTVDAAKIVLKKVMTDLKGAEGNLDRVARITKQKKDAKRQAEQKKVQAKKDTPAAAAAGPAPSTGTATPTPTKVADWKCAYCASVNPGSKHSCKSCGAPKK